MMSQEQFDAIMEKLVIIQDLLERGAGKRIGGIDLAMEVTGYKRATIYAKLKDPYRPIPHRKRGRKLIFLEEELRAWLTGDSPIGHRRGRKPRLSALW